MTLNAPIADAPDYGLPRDYRHGTVRTTMDSDTGGTYWNAQRIALSRHYQFSVYETALIWADRLNAATFLDVGCGTGMKLPMIHRARPAMAIYGVDQPHAVAFCRTQHPFAQFESDDFDTPRSDYPWPRADVIVCADVIEHVADPDRLLAYLRARVSAHGVIVLSTPDRARLAHESVRAPINPDHIREWTFDEFARYLSSRSFTVLTHAHHHGLRPHASLRYGIVLARHLVTRTPRSLRSNQVAVIQPAVSATA